LTAREIGILPGMSETRQTRCVIAGGGPAGMMAGFLLARAGVPVVVLEKHPDFNRDFRGDTIHPSTFELMHELGLLSEFLQQPHDQVTSLTAVFNDERITIADFTHLPTQCKFLGLMPQWDFLNFIASHAKKLPHFELLMQTTVTELVVENEVVTGLRATSPRGDLELRADLVIAADGRQSTLREQAKMKPLELGAPIDVLWMRLSRREEDPAQTFGFFKNGSLFVALNRREYWQCALVIPKGGFAEIQAAGLPAFHQRIADIAPYLTERAKELKDWSQVSLLAVQINRLERWARRGLLCIGDAAHAMSPAGGVGINLAIQDAVATANLLAEKLLRTGPVSLEELDLVQARREWPTKLIQGMQVFIHKRINGQRTAPQTKLPLVLQLLKTFPYLRRFPARFVGMGPRPEHVRTNAVASLNPEGIATQATEPLDGINRI
jgi:2-polyprenyl-6-methoxyphenol hydroxylase-like FAD-dependent oxidoreductase